MRKAMLKMMHPVNPLLGNFISCAKSVPQHQSSPTQNGSIVLHPCEHRIPDKYFADIANRMHNSRCS
jgi:hypothetical protein